MNGNWGKTQDSWVTKDFISHSQSSSWNFMVFCASSISPPSSREVMQRAHQGWLLMQQAVFKETCEPAFLVRGSKPALHLGWTWEVRAYLISQAYLLSTQPWEMFCVMVVRLLHSYYVSKNVRGCSRSMAVASLNTSLLISIRF